MFFIRKSSIIVYGCQNVIAQSADNTERLSEIKSSAERSRVIRLKRIFALKKKQVQRFKNTAERDRAMLDEVERIHREAMERMRGEGK